MNDVIRIIKSRRSIRAFKSSLLRKDEMATIVEAGTWAPTGHNQQSWHFSVVQDRSLIDEVNVKCKRMMAQAPVEWIKKMGQSPDLDITYAAPVLVIISSKKDAMTGLTDCTAAMQNMMLAAESIGIGSCWMGFVNFIFNNDEMMRKLGVPEGYVPQQCAVFGHKAEKEWRAPERKQDVVTYLGSY